jgi:hypothetical protein
MLVCILLHATNEAAQSHQQIHKPEVITKTLPVTAHTTNLKSSSAYYSHWTDQNRSLTSTRVTTMHLSMHRVKLCLDCFYITAKISIFWRVNTSPLLCMKSLCTPQKYRFFIMWPNTIMTIIGYVICIYVTCTCTDTCICTHTYTPTHTHTHTHTHTQNSKSVTTQLLQ